MKTVLAIARETRVWAEAEARFLRFCPHRLGGMCAIASAELHTRLAALGIVGDIHVTLMDDCAHVYLVVEDHVVDITSTQFPELANKKVFIAHLKEAEQYQYYQSSHRFKTVEHLRAYQNKYKWPTNQRVY